MYSIARNIFKLFFFLHTMKKMLYILIFLILIIIALSAILLFYKNTNPALTPEDSKKCTILEKNSPIGVNIVLFAKTQKEAEKYKDYIKNSPPFDEYANKFNFFYIKDYSPPCELYKGIAVLCYSQELIKKSSSCPNDQLVVITDEFSSSIRSSNYLNVMSLNSKHPLTVFLHEFGHSFVNLAEEYVPAKIPRNSAGNCVDKCEKFQGKNDGCFEGCSEVDYMRSIENGVMRTLSSAEYGLFNNNILINKINELNIRPSPPITGKVISDPENCIEQEYYLIEGNYKNIINITNKKIEKGCVGDPGAGGFTLDVILADNSKFNVGNFNPELIYTDAPGNIENEEDILTSPPSNEISGETFDSDINFYLKAPVIKNAKELQIREPGLKITVSIPVCSPENKGDANGDGLVNFADVDHIEDLFNKGNIIYCENNADFNNDSQLTIDDANALFDSLGGQRIPL